MSVRAIAQQLEIPRRTVGGWLSGQLPRVWIRRDDICSRCGGWSHDPGSLPLSYTYLLGLYLGDGCISTHPRAYKLRITLDSAYPGIIDEAAKAMREVLGRDAVNTILRPKNDVEVYAYSKAWPCLFPQHGPGKKHMRPIVLAPWQEELVRRTPRLLLRGLIHSDGCRFANTGRSWRHPRYSFSNLSPDIRRIFTDACDLLGLRWTTAGRTVYVSRKHDAALMDTFIGPKA